MLITRANYHISTFAVFKACKRPSRKPDFISPSGSVYWYGQDSTGGYVVRSSDHWSCRDCGNIASCYWRINGTGNTGKAYFDNFKGRK